ncbi:MAG: cell wall-binding repeat-containing protein [Syntrophomonas sp.]
MLRITTDLTANTVRIQAPTITQFAVNISKLVWLDVEDFSHPRTVVLLPLGRWREAVAGVPLMHFPRNAALLATKIDRLPMITRRETIRLQPLGIGIHGEELPARVFLVGAIEYAVAQAFLKMGFTIMRIRGANSFETAAEIAREITRYMPNPPTMLVPYYDPVDSQPVVALSAHSGAPILFINMSSLPKETSKALKDIKPSAVYIMGRDSQISTSLITEVQSLLPGTRLIRVGGQTITDYSINLARFMDPINYFGWGRNEKSGDIFTFVASGNIYQSIFSATLAHIATHAPELIIPSEHPISDNLRDYLISVNPSLSQPTRPPFMRGLIIGNRKDISVQKQIELESLLIKELGDWPPPG